MAKRRGNGEGTIQELGPRRYKAIVTLSWKPRRTKSRVFDKKADASAWLSQQRSERESGTEPVSDLLFCDWVTTYLADVARDRETGTHNLYKHILESYVVPVLGRFPIADLKPMAFRNLLSELEKDYAESRTLESVYEICSRCMAAAVNLEIIPKNPVPQVSKPKYTRRDIRPFSLEEVKAILKASESHRLGPLFTLAFALGLRQGELFALEWSDVDWEQKTLRIERQAANNGGVITVKAPKTKASRRTLELADPVLSALRDRQKAALKEGQAANPLIFPARRGGYLQRSSFAVRHWKKILEKCGIPSRGMHHTRHTFATHALTQGCPLHVVSKILGHSSPTTTLETYAHLIDTAQRGTVEKVAKLFAG